MNSPLDRSVQALEDAISTPGKSLLRSSKHLPRTARHSLLRQNLEQTINNITTFPNDLTTSFMPNELQNLESFNFKGEYTTLSETLLSGTAVKVSERTAEVFDRMYADFYEISSMHESAPQIFQTIANYMQSCTDTYEIAMDILSKTLGKTRDKAACEIVWLENERNIWRLLYCLYHDRQTVERNPIIEAIPPHVLTEKQCVENLYKTDHLLRECQLIVDWLEKNAADQQYGVHQIEHFTDKTIGWENTFHQLADPNSVVFPSSRPIVQHLDPDAPFREKLPLHDLDIEDEERLCRQIYYEIRCGRLHEAQLLCIHCGHPWRAALLEGWRLFHDPNFGATDDPSIKKPVEGNPQRDLWKLATWETCEDTRLNRYWRATLGVLCGNITPVLSVCEWWEDYLWAYLRVMIDIRVESEIRDTVLRKYHPMPEEYWRRRLSLNEIFEKLPKSEHDYQQHIIHRFLIMDEPVELLKAMKDWAVKDENVNDTAVITELSTSPQLLRFLAHAIMSFREIGIGGNELASDAILESYVSSLIDLNKQDLIAFYTAMLAQPNQIAMYARFLEKILDNDQRRTLLCHAEQAGLDVETITKTVVENIRRKDNITVFSELTTTINEHDFAKIHSLDWLLFYETQRSEAIFQLNAIIRHFLAGGKLDAARQAFNKIPADSVDIVLSNYDENSVPDEIQNTVREYLCYKAYLDGYENFNDWFHHFHHGRPKPPAPVSESAGFTERVAHEHRVSQYKAEHDRWKLTMNHRIKTTKATLYNILLFPDGGWLVDECATANDDDVCRATQIKNLREMFIPKVLLLLHTVMHESEEYKECVQLADIIASENKQIYTVFSKVKLAEVLSKICESSIALMNQKRDPWGYSLGS